MKNISKELEVFTAGNKNNQSIIFLHGFPFDHSMWDKQTDFLKNNYYCISYDIRGLGKSAVGDGQFTMETFVDDLFDIMDYLNLSKPVICGLSMGGYIALRAAERDQMKFKSLVFCDTKSEADNNEAKLKRSAGIKKINEDGAEAYARDFIPNCFTKNFIINNGVMYNYIIERSTLSIPEGVKGSLLAMLSRTDTTGFLSKINIPTLVICGGQDKLATPEQMKALADKIQGSEYKVIAEAAHMTPIENSEEFNKIISEFLEKIN